MQSFSENVARPGDALGEPKAQPFGRLGALVFQLNNEQIIVGEPVGSDPDSRMCWRLGNHHDTAGKAFTPEMTNQGKIGTETDVLVANPARDCVGWAGSLSRYCSPLAPPALHLDSDRPTQECAAKVLRRAKRLLIRFDEQMNPY